jgi:class I fructose-bisphosphate aldolase
VITGSVTDERDGDDSPEQHIPCEEPVRMHISDTVHKILARYEGESAATKMNLARILMQDRLGGSGRLVILPVDQGLEHGPARSFAANPAAYDPHYHFRLAIDAGLSAFAAPVGMLAAGMDTFAGQIPTILKLNSANSLSAIKDQAVLATVDDAVRLNCAAVGSTLYPGSDAFLGQAEELRVVSQEARAARLPLLVWSYPRGGSITDRGETALDIIVYAAHIAVELGAHIVKVKLPGEHIEKEAAKPAYADRQWTDPVARIKHVVQAAFAGRRLVLFSGGAARDAESLYKDARVIRDGDGNGSIIGRNSFQRPRAEALAMLDEIMRIYSGSG